MSRLCFPTRLLGPSNYTRKLTPCYCFDTGPNPNIREKTTSSQAADTYSCLKGKLHPHNIHLGYL